MIHLFVPFDSASLLRDKKFNEPCFGHYNDNYAGYVSDKQLHPYYLANQVNMLLLAPTHQQVIDWFRDTHNIVILPTIHEHGVYGYKICHIDAEQTFAEKFANHSYYEVLNKSIDSALKLI